MASRCTTTSSGLLKNVVDFILERHDRRDLHLLGYCMGGTLAALFGVAAPRAGEVADPAWRLRSISVDASRSSICGPTAVLRRRLSHRQVWQLPGAFSAVVLLAHEPGPELHRQVRRRFYEQLDDSRFVSNYFAMEHWVNDNIPVAGETFRTFVKNLYQQNELVRGEFRLGERRDRSVAHRVSTADSDGQERSPGGARFDRRDPAARQLADVEIDGHRRRARGPRRRRQGAQGVLAQATGWLAERSSRPAGREGEAGHSRPRWAEQARAPEAREHDDEPRRGNGAARRRAPPVGAGWLSPAKGGGSHTAFTAGVLEGLLGSIPPEVDIVALSGTSGGALCAALAWDGLVRGEPLRAIAKLGAFWGSVAATKPLDRMVDSSLMHIVEASAIRWCSPKSARTTFRRGGRTTFAEPSAPTSIFPELRKLARRPGGPRLCIGAVEVLSGHFEVFTGEDLRVECLMASAAIPELFRAVTVPGKGVYWDGLFSHNPPIFELTEYDVNEIWVIQINPSTCTNVPTETHEILDRRNALAGNLSMEQELAFIEMNNRAIAEGRLKQPKYQPIHLARVAFDRHLGYRSKLDRRPEFLLELREYGRTKSRWFLQERESKKYAMAALGMIASSTASYD